MPKQLLFSDAARRKMLEGVDILAHAVGTTLGPTGRNVILSKSFGGPTVTKDGVTVSKEIELADPFENMGAKLVNVVASKTSDIAGDGTTTATILARAIFREGLRIVTSGANPTPSAGGSRRPSEAAVDRADDQDHLAAGLQEGGDRPGRHDLRQQRPGHRQPPGRRGREGRPRRRDHRRGGQDGDHDPRIRRGDAVRQGVPEPLLRHQPHLDGGRARRRPDPAPREEDRQPPRADPPAREGRPVGPAADHHRRGRRGRGPGDPGRQQAPRHPQHLRRQGPRLRRPPQGDARRHGDPHRRPP